MLAVSTMAAGLMTRAAGVADENRPVIPADWPDRNSACPDLAAGFFRRREADQGVLPIHDPACIGSFSAAGLGCVSKFA